MTVGERRSRWRSEKPLTPDERVTAVLEIVAKHHGVAPRRIRQPHRDEIRRLVDGLIAFEDQRLTECAVDDTARSSAYARRVAPTLDTSLRTLQKLPPQWWCWAALTVDQHFDALLELLLDEPDATRRLTSFVQRFDAAMKERLVAKTPEPKRSEGDRALVLEAVQKVQVLCRAISKEGPKPKTGQREFAKPMAKQAAKRVCDVCGVPTKGGTLLRIAAALFGEPGAVVAMEKYKLAPKPVAVISDEVACLWPPEGPRQGRSAKARQK